MKVVKKEMGIRKEAIQTFIKFWSFGAKSTNHVICSYFDREEIVRNKIKIRNMELKGTETSFSQKRFYTLHLN